MNPGEYELMASVENQHWWYVGLRDSFSRVLRIADPNGKLCGGNMLDAGCGTGQNLRWLQETFSPTKVAGFDVSEQAVEIARRTAPAANIYQADLCDSENLVSGDSLDLIVCSDVLYTTGVEPAMSGLQAICDRLKPSGLFLLHLPALNWLYSNHDVAVHTKHRFRRAEVRTLLHRLGLHVELISYRMFFLFPLVVMSRLPSLLFGVSKTASEVRSDLPLPCGPLNWLLQSIVLKENAALEFGCRYPLGSSLIALGRKQ